MSSGFGKSVKISVFGQSHGAGIGVVIDGIGAGHEIDEAALQKFLDRRRPGGSPLTTQRREADRPRFISGIEKGKTTGFPICAIIENTDTRSEDYSRLADSPRPSHADYTAFVKWHGQADMRGGGHFSGRLTAPLCIAGGIALQLLAARNIYVGAHLLSVGREQDSSFPLIPSRELFEQLENRAIPVIDRSAAQRIEQAVSGAKKAGDSLGGVIECAVTGLEAGLGAPMFDGIENRLAAALFGIPALKGVEFGSGFRGAGLSGSKNNDAFTVQAGRVVTQTNNSGGIQGGITNGMPVVVRAAIKPTPSIAKPQKTVSLSEMRDTELVIGGRHDPCIALRAVPVVQAVCAAVILDIITEEGLLK